MHNQVNHSCQFTDVPAASVALKGQYVMYIMIYKDDDVLICLDFGDI